MTSKTAGDIDLDPPGAGPLAIRGGLVLLLEGCRLLFRERSLWFLSLVPIGLALLALGATTAGFILNLDEIHALWRNFWPALEVTSWWSWIWVGPGLALFWLLTWLGVLGSFAVATVASLLLAKLVSAPILDLLSQRVEALVLGVPQENSDSSIVADAFWSFVAELGRLIFLGLVWALLTLAGFVVPGAHVITGPLILAITILFLPLDYAGFALDRRGVAFGERRRWLRANLMTMVGFGSIAFGACFVPGLNLLLLPALVTAGTLLVIRLPPENQGWGYRRE